MYVSFAMFDAIKKTLLAGVGAAVITKEKAEVAFDDFVQQGKVSAADARAMAHKLAQQGRREFKAVSHEVENKVRSLAEINDAKARDRIAELEARIKALEKKRRPARRPRAAKKPATDSPPA